MNQACGIIDRSVSTYHSLVQIHERNYVALVFPHGICHICHTHSSSHKTSCKHYDITDDRLISQPTALLSTPFVLFLTGNGRPFTNRPVALYYYLIILICKIKADILNWSIFALYIIKYKQQLKCPILDNLYHLSFSMYTNRCRTVGGLSLFGYNL